MPIKRVERVKQLSGLSSYQDPHIHPLSASDSQRTNINVYSLNTANQVTVHSNLSCYWMFRCFLTILFVLSGASSKSRCLAKLSHPSSLSRQAKTVILSPKLLLKYCPHTQEDIIFFISTVPFILHNVPLSVPFQEASGTPVWTRKVFCQRIHLRS